MSSKLISPTLRAVVNLNSSKLNAETSKLASAYLSSAPAGGKHELPALKYDYAALQRECEKQYHIPIESRLLTFDDFRTNTYVFQPVSRRKP